MFTFLLIVHALIAAALVTVILMQRSEGGGLGMGSSGPAGLMTARGAKDFLTRTTAVLAGLFVAMAFLMAAYASMRGHPGAIDTSLAGQQQAAPIAAPVAPGTPTSGIPMMGGGTIGGAPAAPAAPDSLTAGALAPASAGLPATKPAEAPKPAAPTVKLRKIDTKAVSDASIGIEGVSSRGSPAAARPAAAPKPLAIDPPAAPAAGNSQ